MTRRHSRAPKVVAEPLESRRLLTAAVPGFAETAFAAGINRAVQMDFAPDGRLFVTQQDGNLRVIKDGQLLPQPFLTVPVKNTGESGLIGITFDPNFATTPFVYVYYTYQDPSGVWWNRISRFTAAGDAAAAGSEQVLFEGDILGPGTWHNAGGMKFGADGKLYVGMGENQQPTQSQNLGSLLGKVLRLNPDGSIPEDNPFFATSSGKYRAVWAYGFRNPFTLDVEAGTGRIFVNDVGAAFWEEVNELRKGANYGWPAYEGGVVDQGIEAPLYTYSHGGGDFDNSAITGAAFYDPPAPTFGADYLGDYFFGDYGTGLVHRMDVASRAVETFATDLRGITDLDVGPDGALYYLVRSEVRDGGRVVRVAPQAAGAPPVISAPPQGRTVAEGEPVTFAVTASGEGLTYQWSRDGVDIPGATGASYTLPAAAALADGGSRFRVTVASPFGTAVSEDAVLTVVQDSPPVATITTPAETAPVGVWAGGETLSFSGTGTDPEDGGLPADAFTWRVDLHHDSHTHPFIAPITGVTADEVQIPVAAHGNEHNIWYRIHLTVTDSKGLTSSTFRDVYPRKVNLSLRTEPAGLSLDLDGTPTPTPFDSRAIVGFQRSLSAPQTQTLNGVNYVFDGWGDGAAVGATRDVLLPDADVTYTARYRPATTLNVALHAHVPSSVLAGTRLPGKSSVAVTNRGDRAVVGPVTVRLVLVQADSGNAEAAELTSTTRALSLAPGATKQVKLRPAQLPVVPEGNYVLVAQAVAPDGSATPIVGGNVGGQPGVDPGPGPGPAGVPIAVAGATVDLAAVTLDPTYGSDVGRRNEKVRLTVLNLGNIPMRGPVQVEFVASLDTTFGGDDDTVLTRLPATVNVAPGRSATLKLNVAYPPQLLPGFYTLVAKLDPDGVLGETDALRRNDVVIGRRSIRAS